MRLGRKLATGVAAEAARVQPVAAAARETPAAAAAIVDPARESREAAAGRVTAR